MIEILANNLGICEYCGSLLNRLELLSDGWRCPYCYGVPTEASFGMENGTKILWVSFGGTWEFEPPVSDFKLRGIIVLAKLP